jgi:hypothetical protein
MRQPAINRTHEIHWHRHCKKKKNLRGDFMRLGNFTDGSASGEIKLPFDGVWRISFNVKNGAPNTKDSWCKHNEADQVIVTIGDADQKKIMNKPEGTVRKETGCKESGLFPVVQNVDGDSFEFAFKFSSGTTSFRNHQMVMDGIATCLKVNDKSNPRKYLRREVCKKPPPKVTAPVVIRRKQWNTEKRHPWSASTNMRSIASQPNMGGSARGSPVPSAQYGITQQMSMSMGSTMNRSVYDTEGLDVSDPVFGDVSVLKTSASHMVHSLSQPSWKDRQKDLTAFQDDVNRVADLEKFVEPKTRNIRFY